MATSREASKKVGEALHAEKEGTLKSGTSGKKVTSRKQAIAIGLSEARKAGADVPPPPAERAPAKKAAQKAPNPAGKTAAKKSAAKTAPTKKTAGKTAAKRPAAKKSG